MDNHTLLNNIFAKNLKEVTTGAKGAFNATEQLKAEHRLQYLAQSTEADRSSKYFDIGFGNYYGSDKHLAILAQYGFNSTDEYEEAFRKTDWSKCYNMFSEVMNMDMSKEERQMIRQALKDADLYNDDVGFESGVELLEVVRSVSPKRVQLLELADELGVEVRIR